MIRLVLALLLASLAMPAATITINVYAALGPSSYPGDSPSYGTTYPQSGTYATTVQDALQAGGADSGDINTDPTALNKVTTVNASELLNSSAGDPLWRGSLNPTGAFSGEVGTFLYFPFSITSTDGTFSMSDVHITQTFSVPALQSAYGYDLAYSSDPTITYNFEEMGFQSGTSTYLQSGEDQSTQVDGFFNTGGYYAFAYNISAAAGATPAEQLANTLAAIAAYGNYTVTTCVSVGATDSGCASVDVIAPAAAIPEPASYALFGAGLLALAALRRKRS
jgi:hypothetical protein